MLGYWSEGAFVASTNAAVVTTVRVLAERDDLRSTFAKVSFGADTLSAGDYSIAQAGGPAESPCPLPISLADCEVAAVSETCNVNVTLNSDRLDNGSVTSGLQRMADAVNASPDVWDVTAMGIQPTKLSGSRIAPDGKVLYGQVMVFHDPENCAATKYNGNRAIVGYATAVVYDVVSRGGNKSMRMRIACDEAPANGGGAYFGTIVPPRFVR